MRIPGLFVSFLLLSACKSDKEKLLVGKWHAVQLVECEEVIPINTSLVNLEFKPNGQYVFNSTLNIHEEGKFRLSGEYLYTQDKVKNKALEKAVLIKSLSPDSLVLQMNFKGKDQWLTLMKEGVTILENNTVDLQDIEFKREEMDSFYVQNELITDNKEELENMEMMDMSDGNNMANTEGGLLPSGMSSNAGKELLKPKVVEKKAEKTPEKKPEKKFDTQAEAYAKREALRKREEAKQKEDERRRYENYIAREKDRKREEAKRKKN